VPVASRDTNTPATEHTPGVVDESDTESPDVAAANTGTGDCARVTSGNVPIAIDCAVSGTTLKLCRAGVAAA